MKYFLKLAYKGTNYAGWQRQKNANSIQQTIEETLSKMIGKITTIVGCGRTDAGVHASEYYCQFLTDKTLDYDPVFRLNKMLPNDISIMDCFLVDKQAQAQFDAYSRTYQYHIHGQKNAFLSELSSLYTLKNLDFNKLHQCANLISQTEDFNFFCKQPNVYKHTRCQITQCVWMINPEEEKWS